MVLTFPGDESYNEHGFIFAGWIGQEEEWCRLESQWGRRLEFERRHGRSISRFQATDCNALRGEYGGWTKEQQVEHVKKLIGIVNRRKGAVVAAGVDIRAMLEVFPDDHKDPIKAAYNLAFREVMIVAARAIKKSILPETKIAIIHDTCQYNGEIQRAFWSLKEDPRWPRGNMFVSCTPMSWRDCVPLQTADMIAFDTCKMLDARIRFNTYRMRRSLAAMLDNGKPILSRYFDKKVLETLKNTSLEYRRNQAQATASGGV